MNIIFRKENLKKTILCSAFLIFGLLFCILPTRMFNFVESTLCMILLIAGIFCIIVYALVPSDEKMFRLLIYGVVSLVFGLLMLIISKFFTIFLAVLIAVNGVSLIIDALKIKKHTPKLWISDFVIGTIVCSLALVTIILCGTKASKNLLAVFFGIILLINGIYYLVELIQISAKHQKTETSIEVNETDFVVLETEKTDDKNSENIVEDTNKNNFKG